MADHRVGGQGADLVERHPHVVEPLLGDLLPGAVLHRLLDVGAGPVETVRPIGVDHELVVRLVPEVRFPFDVPDSSQGESRTVTRPPVTMLPSNRNGSRWQIRSM